MTDLRTADGQLVEEFVAQLRALAQEGTDRAYAMQDDAPQDAALMAKLAYRLDQLLNALTVES